MNNQPAFRRTLLLLGACLGTWLSLPAEEPVTQEDIPAPISLNGEWQFRLARDAQAADSLAGFSDPEFDATDFETIPVPSNWNMHGFEEPHYVNGTDSEGFYRVEFEVPADVGELRTLLHFGGVWVSAEVWVNGYRYGQHDSGFTGFSFDISDAIIPGEKNLLAVRVRQALPNNLFKFDANDDWALAGIYRDVWIEFAPKHLYLASVEVETDLDEAYQDAELSIRAFIIRHERGAWHEPSPPFDVQTRLTTLDGDLVAEDVRQATVMSPHNGRDLRYRIPVKAPLKWTAETPHLYALQVRLIRDGHVIHEWSDRIGFREVSTEGGIFRINGQTVRLRGVNRHDQHPDVGRATRKEHWLEDIQLMKKANINSVRMAHYPAAEGFVRLCDELGMYVLNEIPLGFGGDRMERPDFAEGLLLRIHETVQRDRNRPSVIIWDLGNEDPFTRLHQIGLRVIKGLDSTRPVLLPFRIDQNLPPEVDILAPHYWKTQDYDRLAAEARRPVITTEFTHALGQDDFGEMEQRWEALTRHPAGAGGMVWLWADQGLRRPVDGRPVLHPMRDKSKYTREGSELVREMDAGDGYIYDAHGNYGTDGIVNADRSPQRDYWEVKAVYAPVKIMVDALHVSQGTGEVVIPVRNDFDFTNLNSVKMAWTLYEDANILDSGSTILDAIPHTTARLPVPLDAMQQVRPDSVYYLHVEALDEDMGTLMRSSVRLYPTSQPASNAVADHPDLKLKESRKAIEVLAGENQFVIDRTTGEITSVAIGSTKLVNGSNFVVWRPSTYCERNRYDRRENAPDWDTFMQQLDPDLKQFSVDRGPDAVDVRTKVEYRQDEANAVIVDYHYTIHANGSMAVAYLADVDMDVPELPEVGVVLDLPGQPDALTWLGQGPRSSLPGKTAATLFGWWTASPESVFGTGTKYGLDWAQLEYGSDASLRLSGQQAVRLETDPQGQWQLRVLDPVAGAWTKNGPPENPAWHLNLEHQTQFEGAFLIEPLQD